MERGQARAVVPSRLRCHCPQKFIYALVVIAYYTEISVLCSEKGEELELSRHDVSGRVVLIDCITLWCTNFFYRDQKKAEQDNTWVSQCLDDIKIEFDRFTAQDATFIFVTNEIGMGGVSSNTLQRRFTDLQGWVNQYIASKADEVTLMVSGIPLRIK